MTDKDKLASMLDALINDKPEDAQIAFHGYLNDKMREEIHGVEKSNTPKPENDE